jgi:capsular polysaccharide transport system permease protein
LFGAGGDEPRSGYFVTHCRVVAAMIAREMVTRFGNRPGGYIWALLDPVANIAILTLVFGAIARSPALGTSFPLFFATGFLAFNFYRSIESYVAAATKSNKALLSYPNVAPFDAVVARYVLQLATSSLVAIIVLSVILSLLRVSQPIYWPPILEAIFAASILGLGTAMANDVLFSRYPIYERFYSVVTKPLYLLSGIFFLPDAVPHPFREYLLFNPVLHIVMLFRTGFYPEYRAIGLDIDYVCAWAAVVFIAGMFIFRTNAATLRGS